MESTGSYHKRVVINATLGEDTYLTASSQFLQRQFSSPRTGKTRDWRRKKKQTLQRRIKQRVAKVREKESIFKTGMKSLSLMVGGARIGW